MTYIAPRPLTSSPPQRFPLSIPIKMANNQRGLCGAERAPPHDILMINRKPKRPYTNMHTYIKLYVISNLRVGKNMLVSPRKQVVYLTVHFYNFMIMTLYVKFLDSGHSANYLFADPSNSDLNLYFSFLFFEILF